MASPALSRSRLLSVDDVQRMVEAGILGEDERVELIAGVLVTMAPQGPTHAGIVSLVAGALAAAIPDGWHVREEKPLALDRVNAPEPDVAVVLGGPRDWLQRHPGAGDTALVVEVAWSSQDVDQEKVGLYARAGVPRVWLLDLPGRALTAYADPDRLGRYHSRLVLGPDDEVEVPLAGARWPVRSLLP